jgi:hypothetical protein
VRLYHSDAPDQLTNSPALRAPEIADDFATGLTDLLEKHGTVLKALAPELHFQYLRSAAMYSFLAGRRVAGARYAAECLRQKPFAVSALGLLGAGMVGPRAVNALRVVADRIGQLARSVKPHQSHARSN